MSAAVLWALSGDDQRSHALTTPDPFGATETMCGRPLFAWTDTAPRPHSGVMCRDCAQVVLSNVIPPATFRRKSPAGAGVSPTRTGDTKRVPAPGRRRPGVGARSHNNSR